MARGRGAEEVGHERIEALLEEILVDEYGDDEQFWAFRQAFEDEVSLPADAFVIGEPVSAVAIDYDRETRRGLTERRTLWRLPKRPSPGARPVPGTPRPIGGGSGSTLSRLLRWPQKDPDATRPPRRFSK